MTNIYLLQLRENAEDEQLPKRFDEGIHQH